MSLASPNWFAITAAIVSPGENKRPDSWVDEPITNATAIVSPIARPSPMSTAPTMPLRLCGNTEPRIISHRVAPSATAASFCAVGTVANTSRVIDVMIGVIISATTRPAVMKLTPLRGRPENSVLSTGTCSKASAMLL